MSNNKQSSVEWLGLYIKGISTLNTDEIIEQAKAMHKEEMVNAFVSGEISWGFEGEAEQYYNETFGGNND